MYPHSGRWGKNTRKMGLFENLWEPIILLKRNVKFEISTVLSVSMCAETSSLGFWYLHPGLIHWTNPAFMNSATIQIFLPCS
jgi:hypothetical protein